jgi:hypothetical protein
MSRYIVRFMKDVVGDSGQERELCQHWLEVGAIDKQCAAELAKIDFCTVERLSHWSLHADRIEVLEADFPC